MCSEGVDLWQLSPEVEGPDVLHDRKVSIRVTVKIATAVFARFGSIH